MMSDNEVIPWKAASSSYWPRLVLWSHLLMTRSLFLSACKRDGFMLLCWATLSDGNVPTCARKKKTASFQTGMKDNESFKILHICFCKRYLRKEMHSTRLLDLKETLNVNRTVYQKGAFNILVPLICELLILSLKSLIFCPQITVSLNC